MRFEIIGDTETNGSGDYDYTMLVHGGIVVVGSYIEDDKDLSYMIADENEDTEENNDKIDDLFSKHRVKIIRQIKETA